jgi:diguanylate cyclase (GGDEF)-like protein/PAS domain S-box-containing protein
MAMSPRRPISALTALSPKARSKREREPVDEPAGEAAQDDEPAAAAADNGTPAGVAAKNGRPAVEATEGGEPAGKASENGRPAVEATEGGEPADRPDRDQVDELATETQENVERAAEALLREHSDALVCGLSSNGLIVPIPGQVALWGQAAIEGRAVIDGVVAADRGTVVDLWWRAKYEGGAAHGKVRLLKKPSRWVTLHFLDLRHIHGVLLCILIPSDEVAAEEAGASEEAPAAPRFSSLKEDEGGIVLECDDAFTQMFGFTAEELIGKSVLDQIHPEDQGRAVEGWLAMLSTRRDQHTRLRRKRKDGSWMWVDTTLHNYLNQPDCNHVLIEIIDISAEMAAQEALQEREELLRRLTDAMPVGLLQLDTDRNVVYNNAHLLEILHGARTGAREELEPEDGESAEQADAPPPTATALLSTLTDDGLSAFEMSLERVLDEGIDQDIEVDMVLESGVWRRALMSIRALLRQGGDVSGAITCVLDVTDSARARQELEKRATFDALTGCHNRSSILSSLQMELEQGDASMTGVVYVDLDEFKPVNDKLGHAAGDELLTLVAERLKIASRTEDVVGRLGGDEFLILLRSIPEADVAMRVARRICASLNSKFELSSGTIELRASVGVAWTDAETITAEELIRRADAAMYKSKDQGLGLPTPATEVAKPAVAPR